MSKDTQYVNGHPVAPVENDGAQPLLQAPTSTQQSTPTYGVDKSSTLEYNDGHTETLGDVLDGIIKIRDTGAIKVADPSEDGTINPLPDVLQHMWDGKNGITDITITAAFVPNTGA